MKLKNKPYIMLLSALMLSGAVSAKRAEKTVPDLTPAEVTTARENFKGAAYLDPSRSADERARDLVERMTLDEKLAYLGGTGFVTDKVIGETQPLARLGVPKFKMTDATLGSKLTKDAILFPSFIGLAASFNPELSYAYGKAVAEQCKADGYRILLGPGVNLYRVPNCGRNFEYLGEDPFLTSELTVPYIKGCQEAGVLATVKHLSANNSDYLRKSSNSVIDERTLHEIYFPPFVASIEEADVKAVMTSYNLLNGEWAAESRWLVSDMLRNSWGFDGMVMTDWWSVYNTEKLITSGVDIEMPAAKVLAADKVRELLKGGVITEAYLDERIQCSLRPCIEMGLLDVEHRQPEMRQKWPEHQQVAETIGRESLVLLKNENNLLPLDRTKVKNIVLYGVNAIETVATGGGAAGFDPGKHFVTYEQAIKKAAGENVTVSYLPKLNRKKLQEADAVVVFLTMVEHEAMDRNFVLDEDSRYALARITEANRNVIAVVSLGGGVEMASWESGVKGLIYAWYPGTYGATALGEMLFGDVNPSGKLPITIEKRVEDTHYHGNYLAEGTVLPRTFPGFDWKAPIHDVNYAEGIFTGYRWYDSKSIEPLFPFGFGLSFTRFEIAEPKLSSSTLKSGETLMVQVEVSNCGDHEGAEVVQLYVSDLEAGVPRPEKELKGFRKVSLKPGESRSVTLKVTERDLAFWDPKTKIWTTEPGRFEVRVGNSSRHISGTAAFDFIR
jgi:beta-glucosidase